MTGNRRELIVISALALAVGSAGAFAFHGRKGLTATPRDGSRPSVPLERTPYDPSLVDKTVAFWEAQARRDPQGALERRDLAAAYLARHRETGDIADAVKAEAAARESLKILPRNNAAALSRLARSLIAQHRFPEALEVARGAAAYDPQASRVVADVLIELGDYDAARRALDESPVEPDDLNWFALRARLAEVDGQPEGSLRYLREARRVADARPDMPAEVVAWNDVMIGHALTEMGRLDEAERALGDALAVFPRDYRAMTGMAEIMAWRGDWMSVIVWGDRAIAISAQNPVALKLVGDALAALGRLDEAERHYQALKTLAHSFPRIYDRHWAMFCANNDRDLDEALALARKDLELRRDVHAHDTLAWVCFKKGMLPEAESAMNSALARGTKQATMLYHAGMIARAAEHPEQAKDHFSRARALNPKAIPLRWLRWMDDDEG